MSILSPDFGEADLAVDVLVGARYIAAAEPDSHAAIFHQDTGIAQDFRIPWLVACENIRELFPRDAIDRPGQSESADFEPIAACVQHPVVAALVPHGRLTQSVLIERAVAAQLKDGI